MLKNLRASAEVGTIADALKLAKEKHTENEKRLPEHPWEEWYAAFLYAVDNGADDDDAVEAANIYITARKEH